MINTGFISIGIMFFCLIISLVVFGLVNRKLIDRDLFEIIKQDATYFDPKTMRENKGDESEMKESLGNEEKPDNKIESKLKDNEPKKDETSSKKDENEEKTIIKVENKEKLDIEDRSDLVEINGVVQ